MEELGAVAVANGLARDKKEIHNMAMSETDQVFQSSIEILLTDLYGTIDAQNARRLSELCVGTLYNQLCHRNKRRKKNQDGLEAGHPQDL
jgi:hypothetical protein